MSNTNMSFKFFSATEPIDKRKRPTRQPFQIGLRQGNARYLG